MDDQQDFIDPHFLANIQPKYSVEERLAILERQHLIFAQDLKLIKDNTGTVLEIVEGSKIAFSVFRFLISLIKLLASLAAAVLVLWGFYIAWKTGNIPGSPKSP